MIAGKKDMKNTKGFTLMEIVVYTAIMSVVFGLLIGSFAALMNSFAKARLLGKINSSAETAMERMTREIKSAYDIDSSLSVLNSHPGSLMLNVFDDMDNAAVTEFYLEDGKIMISKYGSIGVFLMSSDISVNTLIFRPIYASSTSKAVKIELEIQGSAGNYQRNEKFYNTVILRGTY